MLSVDDLRTQMSPYPEGGGYMHTPNMQRIANRTVVFERAYVSVALCMPSRTALLTSRRPDTSRCWTIEADQWFRRNETGRAWVTLPGAFKAANYLTLGMGNSCIQRKTWLGLQRSVCHHMSKCSGGKRKRPSQTVQ